MKRPPLAPKMDKGPAVKQPTTSSSCTPKGGRSGKAAMKKARHGSAPSKYGKSNSGGRRRGVSSHSINAGYGY